MHDPDAGRTADESEESWDQWFGRTYGSSKYRRFVLIWAVAIAIALVALASSGNSELLSG